MMWLIKGLGLLALGIVIAVLIELAVAGLIQIGWMKDPRRALSSRAQNPPAPAPDLPPHESVRITPEMRDMLIALWVIARSTPHHRIFVRAADMAAMTKTSFITASRAEPGDLFIEASDSAEGLN